MQTDEHFLTVARYVERNALRAKLVGWAAETRESKAEGVVQCLDGGTAGGLGISRESPTDRIGLEALRVSVRRGGPFSRNAGCVAWRNSSGWNSRYGRVDGREVHK